MGRGSSIPEEQKSEFQKRREALGLSREKAAMLMPGANDDWLERIEKGKKYATPEDALMISEAYNDPELCNYYCSSCCAIGRKYVPAVDAGELSRIVLQMEASLNSFLAKRSALVEIASDGEVSEAEMGDFKTIQADLERLSIAIEALRLWTEKLEPGQ